jgi:L-ascorbate metabolism protein UlaG (beta-lactamase superfamily)
MTMAMSGSFRIIFSAILGALSVGLAAEQPLKGPYVNQAQFPDKGLWDVIKWKWNATPGVWPQSVSVITVTPAAQVQGKALHATFINHATVLIQHNGLNLLFDPQYSDYASPVQFAGPKRVHEPGVRFEDLPRIDAVLISHNHYDHLDAATVKRLVKAHDPLFLAPQGDGPTLRKMGVPAAKVREFRWWEAHDLGNSLVARFAPAQHFSARSMWDRMQSLWGSWVIESPHGPVYHGGDTGWGPHFEQLAERYNGFRLAMLPIGAFQPRWFMKYAHIDPAEAVQAHKVLKSERSLAIHFGTFQGLADDAWHEPAEHLEKARQEAGVPDSEFITPQPGQVLALD